MIRFLRTAPRRPLRQAPRRYSRHAFVLLLLLTATTFACSDAGAQVETVPAPAIDVPRAATPRTETLVVAGGCFWGVEAVFQHVRGVTDVVSGYAGGSADSATYELVSSGRTRHAESVEITYDAAQVSLGQLLHVFFSVAHDPTEVNRQGPDEGPQYRSAIFFKSSAQERIAREYVAQLDRARVFRAPIATDVTRLDRFYPAEAEHQNFAFRYPTHPYIQTHDAPKVARLRSQFPALYVAR